MKNKNKDFYDDGRTIAEMNLPGMPWFSRVRTHNKHDTIKLTRKEFFAILRAGFAVTLPLAAIFVCAYTIIMLFLRFVWLA